MKVSKIKQLRAHETAGISNAQLVDKCVKPINEEMSPTISGVTESADAKIVADDIGTLRKQNVKVGEENQIKSLNVPNNVNDKRKTYRTSTALEICGGET